MQIRSSEICKLEVFLWALSEYNDINMNIECMKLWDFEVHTMIKRRKRDFRILSRCQSIIKLLMMRFLWFTTSQNDITSILLQFSLFLTWIWCLFFSIVYSIQQTFKCHIRHFGLLKLSLLLDNGEAHSRSHFTALKVVFKLHFTYLFCISKFL